MALRVVAVAPPELPASGLGRHTLTSADPASLFNACRVAGQRAANGTGAWGDSNWAGSRASRRESVLLMHSLVEDMARFDALLERFEPNLLLLGAMSVCLPGAVACAVRAKQRLGDRVHVVLGGRHASETIWRAGGTVRHHPGSPVRLIADGTLPPVFDLVVAGPGEHVIAGLGEVIATATQPATSADLAAGIADEPGDWIASWADGDLPRAVTSRRPTFSRDQLPSPAEIFGVGASFDVFGGRLTGHVFSDTGNGCVFDCDFCSERRSVTGGLVDLGNGADRLVRQLRAVSDVVAADAPGRGASAFIEDSTILGGSPREITRLVDLLDRTDLDIRFGGQFTIDQILSRTDLIKGLTEVGMDYVFIGVETLDPGGIGGMSKDRRPDGAAWMSRTEQAIDQLTQLGVQTGAAVLFGLGEPHRDRLALLRQLSDWRDRYGGPWPVSLNWATQHPLRGADGGTGYRYSEWSVPAGEWAEAFDDFGEATTRYPLSGCAPPVLAEVQEIRATFHALYERPSDGGAR
ncbi:B12-binding domain/radical SAM domain-containing protein [Micromonospora sp. NBC_01392]|uniref:B12-binding domain/radical SAM domain-containing protein n=1 Tax=Micromonospora sp. NBC_01392 TaxID=2903588 RepID=UPI0032559EC5